MKYQIGNKESVCVCGGGGGGGGGGAITNTTKIPTTAKKHQKTKQTKQTNTNKTPNKYHVFSFCFRRKEKFY